jgi:dTDP-4-dehydrorhamnose 3,5-epimerase
VKTIPTALEGVMIIEPEVFTDERGYFLEGWHHRKYNEAGIPHIFVQDNISYSVRNVLRGIHFQNPGEQGKLVAVRAGAVFDVAVDLRTDSPTFRKWIGTDSPTFRKWIGVELSEENNRQLFIPAGFGHGFKVLSSEAIFVYKCTEYYQKDYEHSLRWDDPDIGIEWPGDSSHIMSSKDATAPFLSDLPPGALPKIAR